MAILPEEEFITHLTPSSRLLGLDVGTKTIGVAVGSALGGFASPVQVIARRKIADDARALGAIISEYQASALVVGWPLAADGTPGPKCQSVRDVMLEILKFLPDLPLVFYDERFSTKRAEQFMIGTVDMSRKKRGEIVDKMAAQIILQDFLDRLAD